MNEPQALVTPRYARRTRVLLLLGLVGIALLFAYGHLATAQAWDTATPVMLLARGFDLALWAAMVLGCVGIGARGLRWLKVATLNLSLQLAFAFGLGAGGLALVLLGLGFLHLLYAPIILGLVALCIILSRDEWSDFARQAVRAWQSRAPLTGPEKALVIALAALTIPVLLSALTPPLDNDALNYHLYAPAEFLRNAAVFPMFDNVGANYPIATDLLYLLGLAAGTDIVAHLVSFAFAGAVTLAVFGYCAARFSRVTGLLACVIFWCSSVIALEASAPIIDLAWSAYEFFAVLAFLLWREKRSPAYLIMLGVMLGLAASNKYLALVGWGVMPLLVAGAAAWDAWREPQPQRVLRVARAIIVSGAAVLLPALVAAPWYLKNAVWFGNPVFPFFTGAYGLDGALHPDNGDPNGWVGLGLGRDIGALLAFPYNVYLRWENFNYSYNRGGPTFFFWLLPLYLLAPKRAALNWLALIVLLRFGFWFLYAQNMRYLVLIFPLLAILTAYSITGIMARWHRPFVRVGLATFVVFCIGWGIFTQWGFLLALRVQAVEFVAGQISRDTYLEQNLLNYRAIQFMNTTLPQDARVLALGDQRLYYAERATVVDTAHDHWLQLVRMGGDADGIARTLRALDVTHVWVSEDDLLYFENNWNYASPLETQLFEQFRSRHLREIYADADGHTVYQLD